MISIRFTPTPRFLTCTALLFALGGCASGVPGLNNGPDADTKYSRGYVSNNLVKGKTTMADVKQKFGPPGGASESFSAGKTVTNWSYKRNAEGFSSLVDLAHKYVPVDTSLAMYSASSNIGRATSAATDVGNVTGTNTADQRTSFNAIEVLFVDGVLANYELH